VTAKTWPKAPLPPWGLCWCAEILAGYTGDIVAAEDEEKKAGYSSLKAAHLLGTQASSGTSSHLSLH
jgi:hypothetical protein